MDFLKFQKSLKPGDVIYDEYYGYCKFIGFSRCNMGCIISGKCEGEFMFAVLDENNVVHPEETDENGNPIVYDCWIDYKNNSLFIKIEEFIKEEEFSI